MNDTLKEPNTSGEDLEQLATQINAEHDACIKAAKSTAEHAYLAGQLLIQAKDKLKQGQWLPWLRENCTVSERQSQRYMKIARELPELANPTRASDLSLRQALQIITDANHNADDPANDAVEGEQADTEPSVEDAEDDAESEAISDEDVEPDVTGKGEADGQELEPQTDSVGLTPHTDAAGENAAPSTMPTVQRKTGKSRTGRLKVRGHSVSDYLTFEAETPEAKAIESLVAEVNKAIAKRARSLLNKAMETARIDEVTIQQVLLEKLVESLSNSDAQ